jgi:hypothetical protein
VHIARTRRKSHACEVLLRKPEGESPLRRSSSRSEDKIKIGVQDIGWEDVDWINFARNGDQWRALVNTVTCFWVPMKLWISRVAEQLLTIRKDSYPRS